MSRNISHLTGHELAALAAPFENPHHRSQRGENRKITFPELPADFRQKLAATGKAEIKALAHQVKNTLWGRFDYRGGDVEAFMFGFFLQYKGRPITDKELMRVDSLFDNDGTTPLKELNRKAHQRAVLDTMMLEAARQHAGVVLYGEEGYDQLLGEREMEALYWEHG